MNKSLRIAIVVGLALGVLAVAGCRRVELSDYQKGVVTVTTAPASTETTTAPLGGAQALNARLRMAVGDLSLSGGATAGQAFDASMHYQPKTWKPVVRYEPPGSAEGTAAAIASLWIDQPEVKGQSWPNMENSWKVKLASGVPTDLSLKLGVGTSNVDLSDVDIRTLELVTGVGSTTLDLTGARTATVTADVESGIGELTIKLPKDVGVRVTGGKEGVGDLSSNGFTQQGGALVNAAYAGSGPKIEIALTRGVGSVELRLE